MKCAPRGLARHSVDSLSAQACVVLLLGPYQRRRPFKCASTRCVYTVHTHASKRQPSSSVPMQTEPQTKTAERFQSSVLMRGVRAPEHLWNINRIKLKWIHWSAQQRATEAKWWRLCCGLWRWRDDDRRVCACLTRPQRETLNGRANKAARNNISVVLIA